MTIKEIVEKTRSAYSFKAYGEKGWRGAIRVLRSYGLSDREIIGFLCSKHTRWARDNDGKRKYGRYNGQTIKEYLLRYPQYVSREELRELL